MFVRKTFFAILSALVLTFTACGGEAPTGNGNNDGNENGDHDVLVDSFDSFDAGVDSGIDGSSDIKEKDGSEKDTDKQKKVTLVVKSDYEAKVELDGNMMGTRVKPDSPAEFKVEPGTHKVLLKREGMFQYELGDEKINQPVSVKVADGKVDVKPVLKTDIRKKWKNKKTGEIGKVHYEILGPNQRFPDEGKCPSNLYACGFEGAGVSCFCQDGTNSLSLCKKDASG
ncbi:MAG: hypothetical protein ABEJ02_01395, partial [Candidatus Paceibacteria bacterium]